MNHPLHYESHFSAQEIADYKKVKLTTMRASRVARALVALLVDGTIGDTDRSRKEFLVTHLGTYRLSMRGNSDNTTEVMTHARMGVTSLAMDDDAAMLGFLKEHGYTTNAEEALAWFHTRFAQDLAA